MAVVVAEALIVVVIAEALPMVAASLRGAASEPEMAIKSLIARGRET